MHKTGIRWEDVTIDNITVEDLDDESFKIFRKAALKRKRMTEAELNVSNEELLRKLHLMVDGKLKRSAVLLFYSDPEIVQTGSFIKVGKFDEHGRVVYHNDLNESLIVNASKVIDLIYLMFLKAKIRYEHDVRIEEYPFAREAIREAVYNAIAHNCYMYGTPIQIRITEETISITNRCILPEGWTVETLMGRHDSIPYNPDIANVFYRAGFIENWGQGIQKMCDECAALGTDLPVYDLTGTVLRITFKALERALIKEPKGPNDEKTGLGGEKQAFTDKNLDHVNNEQILSDYLLRIGYTTPTREKILKLYAEFGENTFFARADIMNEIGLTATPASELLRKMKATKLIKSGEKRGKYRFIGWAEDKSLNERLLQKL